MDGLSPSLVTVPAHILTSLIKNRSPVVQYGAYLDRNREGTVQSGEGKSCTECPVCLGRIFQMDEIRELCNCCHIFHRECLDRWVDEKKVTCPLCRAVYFPLIGTGGGPEKIHGRRSGTITSWEKKMLSRVPMSCLVPDNKLVYVTSQYRSNFNDLYNY